MLASGSARLMRVGGRAAAQLRNVSAKAVTFERQGAPAMVAAAKDVNVGDSLGAKQVLVKMVAAPVAPVDLAAVAGLVPGAPASGTCGNEGVGVVEQVGSSVSGLKKGDHVVPAKLGVGTWASYAVAEEEQLYRVPAELDVEQAALLGSAAATALRVLSDVGGLASGDTVVVDGANGPMGLPLVQIAKAKGLRVVSVVDEDALDFPAVSDALKAAGSEAVVSASGAGSHVMRKIYADIKPKLAVHASASGSTATDLARALAPGGTLVALAGSGPVRVPSSLLAERGITVQGFSLQGALAQDKGCATFEELVSLAKAGALKQAVARKEPLANFGAAIKAAASGLNGNVLLTM